MPILRTGYDQFSAVGSGFSNETTHTLELGGLVGAGEALWLFVGGRCDLGGIVSVPGEWTLLQAGTRTDSNPEAEQVLQLWHRISEGSDSVPITWSGDFDSAGTRARTAVVISYSFSGELVIHGSNFISKIGSPPGDTIPFVTPTGVAGDAVFVGGAVMQLTSPPYVLNDYSYVTITDSSGNHSMRTFDAHYLPTYPFPYPTFPSLALQARMAATVVFSGEDEIEPNDGIYLGPALVL